MRVATILEKKRDPVPHSLHRPLVTFSSRVLPAEMHRKYVGGTVRAEISCLLMEAVDSAVEVRDIYQYSACSPTNYEAFTDLRS